MKILGAHDGGGCGYYRMILALTQLGQHGHDVTIIEQGKSTVQDYLKGDYDVIVGQRFSTYNGMSMWRRTRKPSNRLVFENDDDVFSITMENFNAYQYFSQEEHREAIRVYCATSDLLTVTNDVLAGVYREHNPNIAVLPNYVPALATNLSREDRDYPTIGWVGGSSHGRDVHVASSAVRRFMKRFPDWHFIMGGTDYRPSFQTPKDRTHFTKWTQVNDDAEGFYRSIDFDIGICPLLSTTFSRGKSYIKALEYAARGIPCIASDVEPYREFVEDGVNGFLVKTEHEWLDRLTLLARDSELRWDMGVRAHAKAQQYTIEENWQKWETAYSKLFS